MILLNTLSRKLGEYYLSIFDAKTGYLYREIDIEKIYFRDTAPEMLDISIIKKCNFGCPYCYMSSTEKDNSMLHIEDIEWLIGFFGKYKPYQVAIGGGEPSLHPNFIEILKIFRKNSIVPNYTTNGLALLDDKIVNATVKYCGGVALTYHPHRPDIFTKALNILSELPIQRNIHLIVSHKNVKTIEKFIEQIIDRVDTIVLLKFMDLGRGSLLSKDYLLTKKDYEIVKRILKKYPLGKIAVGAPFIPVAIETAVETGISDELISLFYYNPEGILTGYIDEELYLAPSSYWTGEKVYLRDYNSFIEAYNSPLMRKIRIKQYKLKEKCKYAPVCNGGVHGECSEFCSLKSI